jgi:hypothetical protein
MRPKTNGMQDDSKLGAARILCPWSWSHDVFISMSIDFVGGALCLFLMLLFLCPPGQSSLMCSDREICFHIQRRSGSPFSCASYG